MYPYFYTGGSSKISTDTGNSFYERFGIYQCRNRGKFSELFQLSPNAMAPGYGLAENVCLATFASQDYRVLKLDYEAYQKNRAIVLDEVPEGTQVKEIVSVGKPVKDLTVVIGNPKTKKVYSDLHIGEIFISGDSVANGYWGNLKKMLISASNWKAMIVTSIKQVTLDFYMRGICISLDESRKC